MDYWQKARSFAEGAAKEISKEAAKRSQDLTNSISFFNIVSETAKRSKEIAAEASKRAKSFGAEAVSEEELERYGVSEALREFVKEITFCTFRDFPLQDDSEISEVMTVSNVRHDLSEWQAKHANLVLSTVKEISKLRYELCPRYMKERKFWRIYFILMNNHVLPYEKRYMEACKKSVVNQIGERLEESPKNEPSLKQEENKSPQKNKKSTSSSADQDLDVFLLGEDSDEGPDDDDDGDDVGLDDDLDKMVDSSDDEKEKM